MIPTTVTFGPARPGDVPSARVSAALALSDLGWAAQKDFAEGLSEIADERRRHHAAAAAYAETATVLPVASA
jgi:nucleoside-diphosphate-sugar epimerase